MEYKEHELDGRRFIHFIRNTTEADRLSYTYLSNLEKGAKGYFQEEYERQKVDYGVIVPETNR